MTLTQKEVEHIARLARLGLTAEEKEAFAKQLSAILDYAEILKKIDTQDVPPTSHAIPMKNVLREDKVIPFENPQSILANAPQQEKGMLKVPKILE